MNLQQAKEKYLYKCVQDKTGRIFEIYNVVQNHYRHDQEIAAYFRHFEMGIPNRATLEELLQYELVPSASQETMEWIEYRLRSRALIFKSSFPSAHI